MEEVCCGDDWQQTVFYMELLKREKQSILRFGILYLLAVSSILRTAVHYKDDIGRAWEGYRRWYQASRYVNDVLSVLLHADIRIGDISPFGQLFAVLVMAVSSVLLIRVFTDRAVTWKYLAAAAPLALSPYFLECFTFQFDAPYMALSVLFSLIPFLFQKKSRRIFTIVSIICLLLMCMTYQTASGIFPMIIVFRIYTEWNSGRSSLKDGLIRALPSAAVYLAVLISYRIFLVRELPFYSEAAVPSGKAFFSNFLVRYLYYYWRILRDLKVGWLLLIIVTAAAWWGIMVFVSGRRKWASFFMGGLTLLSASVFAGGVYLFFKENQTQPRMMFGFGVFLAVLGVTGVNALEKRHFYAILCAALSWCFFTFSLNFGNVLGEQQRYSQLVTGTLLSDLNRLKIMKNGQKKELIIHGDAGLSPAAGNACENCTILYRLLHSTLGEYRWSEYTLRRYYDLPDIIKAGDDGGDAELPLLADTVYYKIRGDDSHLEILFPKSWADAEPADNPPAAFVRRITGLAD